MTSRLTLLTICLFTFNFQNIQAQDLDTVTIAGRIMDQLEAAGIVGGNHRAAGKFFARRLRQRVERAYAGGGNVER